MSNLSRTQLADEALNKFKRYCTLEMFMFFRKTKLLSSFKIIRDALALIPWESYSSDSTVIYDCLQYNSGDEYLSERMAEDHLVAFDELAKESLKTFESLMDNQKNNGNTIYKPKSESSIGFNYGLSAFNKDNAHSVFNMCIPETGDPTILNRKRKLDEGKEDHSNEISSPSKKYKASKVE